MDPLYYQTPDWSPYSFVANNPINLYDLAGLKNSSGLSDYWNANRAFLEGSVDGYSVWDNIYGPQNGGMLLFGLFPGTGVSYLLTYPGARRIRIRRELVELTGYYAVLVGEANWLGDDKYVFPEEYEWKEYKYKAWVKIYEEVDGIGIGAPVILRDFPNWGQYYNYTPWMKTALKEKGIKTLKGADRNEPRIVEYLKTTTYANKITDEVPWCSAFMNWTLKQNGIIGTNSASAISWLNFGIKLNEPRYGAIVVFPHHVAYYIGNINGTEFIFGGNQSGQVRYSSMNTYPKPLAYIWPIYLP